MAKTTKTSAKQIKTNAKISKVVRKAGAAKDASIRKQIDATRADMLARLYADERKTQTQPSRDDVLAMWPNERGEWILSFMKEGLPYLRAVKRSLRYFKTGKYA